MEQRPDPRALSGHKRLVPRKGRPAPRPEPLRDPRVASVRKGPDPRIAAAGRRAGIVLATIGVFWIGTTALGDALGWPTRVRVFLDLLALAGFGWALYLTWQVWLLRRADRG